MRIARLCVCTVFLLASCRVPAPQGPPLRVDDAPRKPVRRMGLKTQPHPEMVEIRTSLIPGAGQGLFAKEVIPDGTYIGPYSGRYLAPGTSDALADTREGLYLFTLPQCAQDDTRDTIAGDIDDYISKVNFAPETINGHPTHLQNVMFATACKEPFVRLYATRDIAADEELYVDYGPYYDYHFMDRSEVQQHFLHAAGLEATSTFEWEYGKNEAPEEEATAEAE
jgi:hypothetical protein